MSPFSSARARVHREPVIGLDERVWGYAVGLTLDENTADDAVLHELYLELDLTQLVADRAVFIPALDSMLDGELPARPSGGRLVLNLPSRFATRPDAEQRAAALRTAGLELALKDFTASPEQNRLLSLLDFVVIEPSLVGDALADTVELAHSVGVLVVAEGVADVTDYDRCASAGVDALLGSQVKRQASIAAVRPRVLRPGQMQCLAVLHLLSQEPVDLPGAADVIDTDPVLTVRVLNMINSGAFGLREQVDTVNHAVVLLGPRELSTLVTSLALDARRGAMDQLWQILTRSLTCEALTSDRAAYTVGMLSGLITAVGVEPELVLEKVGVSANVADAVRDQTGELGAVLAAVLAQESGDHDAVREAGFDPTEVSETYLSCLSEALSTAEVIGG